jgi:hypothetical protein
LPATLLDIFHATPKNPLRLIPIALDNQCVASVAALRETKIFSSVLAGYLQLYQSKKPPVIRIFTP